MAQATDMSHLPLPRLNSFADPDFRVNPKFLTVDATTHDLREGAADVLLLAVHIEVPVTGGSRAWHSLGGSLMGNVIGAKRAASDNWNFSGGRLAAGYSGRVDCRRRELTFMAPSRPGRNPYRPSGFGLMPQKVVKRNFLAACRTKTTQSISTPFQPVYENAFTRREANPYRIDRSVKCLDTDSEHI